MKTYNYITLLLLASISVLNAQTKKLVVQPNATDGIDAIISNRLDMINSNFATEKRMQVVGWTGNEQNSPDQDWRSLIKFSALDQLKLNNSKVVSAKLTIYANKPNYFNVLGANASKFYLVTSSWSENSVTWNTQPTFAPNSTVSISQTGLYDSIEVDITQLVKKIVNDNQPNYGFMHKLDVEDPYSSFEYTSSDYSVATNRPKLTVTYSDEACLESQPNVETGIDAMICNRLDMINSNFGNNSSLQVVGWTGNTQNSPDQDWRTLLKFSAIDTYLNSNEIVDSAYIYLYAPENKYFPTSGNNAGTLYVVTSSWDELGVTWNTQPTYSENMGVSIPAQTDNFDSLKINITSLVNSMNSQDLMNYGFMYKLVSEEPYSSIEFLSSDATNTKRRPKIKICGSGKTVITDVADSKTSSQDMVYPNPTRDKIYVQNWDNYDSYSIIDNKGNVVISEKIRQEISVKDMTNGLYTIIFSNPNTRKLQKFIKE
ncbi:MAG: DNRLRE domain-containing protein [Cytophagales bacterium]